jgi:hypothetical protein
MGTFPRRVRYGAVGVLAVGLGGLAVPHASAAVTSNAVVSSVSTSEVSDAANYWTPERMANAKPADIKTARMNSSEVSVGAAKPDGPAVTVEPAAPAGGAPADASSPVATAAAAVPRPYTNLPDSTIGKVFFTKASGGNFVCSGTAVNSKNKAEVDTAGHCVADNVSHKFHRNWIFVPAYASTGTSSTTGPYGKWTANRLVTTSAWINNSTAQFKEDYGAVVVNRLSGTLLVNRVGGQGLKWNFPRAQAFSAFGYPQASPFNGQSQYRCNSNWLADDNPGGVGPAAIKIACNMTGGASGGGWLTTINSIGLGYINGHNDYKYNNNVNYMYSPYYGNDELNVYNAAANISV